MSPPVPRPDVHAQRVVLTDEREKPSYREMLAGFWNSWFHPREIEAARSFAATASEKECAAELERLYRVRDDRLEQWRLMQ